MTRTRFWLLLLVAAALGGNTGCMNGFLNDDDDSHLCEYQREPARKSLD
jgi:hypothetical protein